MGSDRSVGQQWNRKRSRKHEARPTVGLMLGQRRRRWTNIKPTEGPRFVYLHNWCMVTHASDNRAGHYDHISYAGPPKFI